MGNKTQEPIIQRSSFEFLSVIGKGGFGKVWRVRYLKSSKEYAMKEMSKVKIIEKNCVSSVLSERDLLSKMRHPFIVNMIFSFQDEDNLYFGMDLLTGGDLRYHICKRKNFSENQSKFFASCIILGLEFFHANNIIHRDIKPENLIFDYKGYMKITDLGIAKQTTNQISNDTSGTPGYMAPEVLNGQNHTFSVDYYALGIICYELMMGVRPYMGDKNEIKEKILSKQILIKNHEIPDGWSNESADFINCLIQRKPNNRLGHNGINHIKNHKWFNGFSWSDLYNMKITSPYIPSDLDNYDDDFCSQNEYVSDYQLEKYNKIKNSENYKNCFKNYLNYNLYENNDQNAFSNMKNPHSKYEDQSRKSYIYGEEDLDINNNVSKNSQRKYSNIPELSNEAKAYNKFNLFSNDKNEMSNQKKSKHKKALSELYSSSNDLRSTFNNQASNPFLDNY